MRSAGRTLDISIEPLAHHVPVSFISQGKRIIRDGLLWIGPHEELDGQIAEFRDRRSVEPCLYTPYTPPPQTLLEQAAVVWVYDVEIPARFRQLQTCCAYARRTGANLLVFAVSCLFNAELRRRENSELARRALDIGARILPQFSRI